MNSLVTLQPLVLKWICSAIKGWTTVQIQQRRYFNTHSKLHFKLGREGIKNIADDIIVFGSTRAEHDANLDKCLQLLAIKGLRLRQSKCDFQSSTLLFFVQDFPEWCIVVFRASPLRSTESMRKSWKYILPKTSMKYSIRPSS